MSSQLKILDGFFVYSHKEILKFMWKNKETSRNNFEKKGTNSEDLYYLISKLNLNVQ